MENNTEALKKSELEDQYEDDSQYPVDKQERDRLNLIRDSIRAVQKCESVLDTMILYTKSHQDRSKLDRITKSLYWVEERLRDLLREAHS